MAAANNSSDNSRGGSGSSSSNGTFVHLIAGGAGGTAGAVLTCPLEVVKTRLQSSTARFEDNNQSPSSSSGGSSTSSSQRSNRMSSAASGGAKHPPPPQLRSVSSWWRMRGGASPPLQPPAFSPQLHLMQHMHSLSSRLSVPLMSSPHSPFAQFCSSTPLSSPRKRPSIVQCFRYIWKTEGFLALWKGLLPNLVGVAPSRAIYFSAYSQTKQWLNSYWSTPDTAAVHMCSAGMAGFFTATFTNPLWLIKTRLQLDQHVAVERLTITRCIANIKREYGLRGFYKGVQASYWGISETIIHFVTYEYLKSVFIVQSAQLDQTGQQTGYDFLLAMGCGGTSKLMAATLTYPHELARTRLREEGHKYLRFWQTLQLVWREEGRAGLYRGLGIHLFRQIPNTAIMMATYELCVQLLSNYL